MSYKKLIVYMILIGYVGGAIPAEFEPAPMSVSGVRAAAGSSDRKHVLSSNSPDPVGYEQDDEDLQQVVEQGNVALERRKGKRRKGNERRDATFKAQEESPWSLARKNSIERHRSRVSESSDDGESVVFYSKAGHEVWAGYRHQLLLFRKHLVKKGIIGEDVQQLMQHDWQDDRVVTSPQEAYVAAVYFSQRCDAITELCESHNSKEKESGDAQKNNIISMIKQFNHTCSGIPVLADIVRNLICRTDCKSEKAERGRVLGKLEEGQDEDMDSLIWKGYGRLLEELAPKMSQLENKTYFVDGKSIGNSVGEFIRLKESYVLSGKNQEGWIDNFEQFKREVRGCPVFDFMRSIAVLSSVKKDEKKDNV